MEQIIFQTPGIYELVRREGQAVPIELLEPVNLTGDINTVTEFLAKRPASVPNLLSHVVMDTQKLTITLKTNEQTKRGFTIQAQLKVHPKITEMGINTNKTYDRTSLEKMLRFNRLRFANQGLYSDLITALRKFNVSTTGNIKAENDNRGNVKTGFEKTAETSLPSEFALNIPPYEGLPAMTFFCELLFDVSDGGVRFWLESVELAEIMEKERDRIFSEQAKVFSDAGLVVIRL